MTLKIESFFGRGGTKLRLSGELLSAHLEEVQSEIEKSVAPVTLDLEEVNRVDIEGIRLLNACQVQGVLVTKCAPYIRAWMRQEAARKRT